MTQAEQIAIGEAYEAKFGNSHHVVHVSIMHLEEFSKLQQRAIDKGKPLTRGQVEGVFGPQGWEW